MNRPNMFHHPDISLPVIRRRATEEFLDLMAAYGKMVAERQFDNFFATCFPSTTARDSAAYRLRKAGVIAYQRAKDGSRVLRLAPGRPPRDVFDPQRLWKRPWSGRWSVLTYDVAEEERVFRDSLRRFLKRLRMGCLQKSVWISPDDIRPDYDDLRQTLQIDFVAYLFEARTVLGRRAEDIVRSAWDFARLRDQHGWYLGFVERHHKLVLLPKTSASAVNALAREEITAYLTAMDSDPLLPRRLIPVGYTGFEVFDAHQRFVRAVRRRIARGT